jgi:hypothetical protein
MKNSIFLMKISFYSFAVFLFWKVKNDFPEMLDNFYIFLLRKIHRGDLNVIFIREFSARVLMDFTWVFMGF